MQVFFFTIFIFRDFHYLQAFFKLLLIIFVVNFTFIKGCLCYKTITSQNIPFEAQFKIFKSLYFLSIPWFTKSVTSWWVSIHETGCIFAYIFWTTTHQVNKLGQLIDINTGKKFSGIFWTIWRSGAKFQIFFDLATCSNYSITSYVKITVFQFFEKVNKDSYKW